MFLTSQMLLSYQRCSRQLFLDLYGDKALKGHPSDFRIKLSKDRIKYRSAFLESEGNWVRPDYPHQDWEAGARATLDLMQQGVPHIHGGVLKVQSPEGHTFISTPDLLTRESGVSVLGSWYYTSTDIKLSKRPKQEYQILAAYHAFLLAQMQGIDPPESWLYLRDKGWYQVDLDLVLPKLLGLIPDLIAIVQQEFEPEVFIVRNRCQLCAWFDHCYSRAQHEQHLSLLPGVTPSRYPILLQHNLRTVEAIAALQPHQLNQKTGFGLAVSQQLIYQARSTVSQRPLLLETPEPFIVLSRVPDSPIELYFDIEAEPSINVVYLNGVLLVNQITGHQEFFPFVAETPDQERQAWEEFVAFVMAYPQAPIYHFCPYEVQTVKRLARQYGASGEVLELLLPRFIDVHRWITQAVTLPVENYTLKVIARWIGFEWRNAEANGAQSICWYEDWLKTGDRTLLDIILEYNEDDW
ncbi:TM0106 family RecB-like putative nuclease [Lyngbya confervoides]|uniref:TM0106 family RecB-like putative nuclease n=1 Tax=Lyngbya confervoides BDU141951 TaxID=1574623 RepID=A0ABD4SZG8_9CYAN|nr:TM0106 family RecB-like putative nuclease [Lyngbya confervoides]MCM1981551.1 TM0106 family RecB-like putative nuclease [Lyngbya confervoides BDU141951]